QRAVRRQLDALRARPHLFADCAAAVVGAVRLPRHSRRRRRLGAVSPGHADDLAAGDDARARDIPALHRVAGRNRDAVRRAYIPDGRDARGLGRPDVSRGPERRVRYGLTSRAGTESKMDMQVKQAGQDDAAGEVNAPPVAIAADAALGNDIGDATILDHDREAALRWVSRTVEHAGATQDQALHREATSVDARPSALRVWRPRVPDASVSMRARTVGAAA